jgi:hypothetical protein
MEDLKTESEQSSSIGRPRLAAPLEISPAPMQTFNVGQWVGEAQPSPSAQRSVFDRTGGARVRRHAVPWLGLSLAAFIALLTVLVTDIYPTCNQAFGTIRDYLWAFVARATSTVVAQFL